MPAPWLTAFANQLRKARRALTWIDVHEAGAGFAEATEGLMLPIGRVWERCRYEASPSAVTATVKDSNALAPGSSWEKSIAAPSSALRQPKAVPPNRGFVTPRVPQTRLGVVVWRYTTRVAMPG